MCLTIIALLSATSVIATTTVAQASLPDTLCANSNNFYYKVCSDGIEDITTVCDKFVTSLDRRGCPRGLGSCGGSDRHLVWRWSSSKSGIRCPPATVDAAWTEATGDKYGGSNCGSGLMARDVSGDHNIDIMDLMPGVSVADAVVPLNQFAGSEGVACRSERSRYPVYTLSAGGVEDAQDICQKLQAFMLRQGCPHRTDTCRGVGKSLIWNWAGQPPPSYYCGGDNMDIAWKEVTNNKYGPSHCGGHPLVKRVGTEQLVHELSAPASPPIELAADVPLISSTTLSSGATPTCHLWGSAGDYTIDAYDIPNIPAVCKDLQKEMSSQGCRIPVGNHNHCRELNGRLRWDYSARYPGSPYCGDVKLEKAWADVTKAKYDGMKCPVWSPWASRSA